MLKIERRHQHTRQSWNNATTPNVIAQAGTVITVMPEGRDGNHGDSPLDILLMEIKSKGS
jgi:hypothetical protein